MNYTENFAVYITDVVLIMYLPHIPSTRPTLFPDLEMELQSEHIARMTNMYLPHKEGVPLRSEDHRIQF